MRRLSFRKTSDTSVKADQTVQPREPRPRLSERLGLKPRGLQPIAWLTTRTLRPMLRTLGILHIFNVEVVNSKVIPDKGAAILASNHISLLDGIFLWAAAKRNVVAMAMAELWKIPVVNIFLYLQGHIPVKRGDKTSGAKAIKAAVRVIKASGLFAIYLPGKCARPGEKLKSKPGAVLISITTGAPIIPVGIKGSNLVLPLGAKKITRHNRKHKVTLKFGDPIYPSDYVGDNQLEDMMAYVDKCVEELSA
jgi:1-acyl-sn-glycerol-3-phosphate acyltransferase